MICLDIWSKLCGVGYVIPTFLGIRTLSEYLLGKEN